MFLMSIVMSKPIVYKIEDGMDPRDVLCTTYQMRNFYRQMGDGYFTNLDIMNYIQHHQITRWIRPHNHVLDVCCGRGLLLPMLRYQRKDLGSYTGVDIEPKNATFLHKRVTDNRPIDFSTYYPFPVTFVESNVAEMASQFERQFDVIVYTSSIEHMQKDAGQQSLYECHKVSKPGTILIITCPNTPEDQDGFDTQYKAHVYEWKRSELLEGLERANFKVLTEWGLIMSKRDLLAATDSLGLTPLVERISQFVPPEWYLPVFSIFFPKGSREIGLLCKAI